MKSKTTEIRTRRRYDKAFKEDAVNRVLRTGKSCAEVARELGIRANLLARWRQEYLQSADRSCGQSSELKPSEMAAELHKARRENEDLREQRDILKKALSIFSRQPSNGEMP